MSANKRISIIIPLYNAERTLVRTLGSICCQIGESDEIIVVDDCSSDTSLSICRRFAEKYSDRIRIIGAQYHRGPSASRNMGTEAACGNYICYVDSDDKLAPNALETMFCFAEENDCDIVQAGYYYVCGNSLLRKKRNTRQYANGKVLSRREAMHSLVMNDFVSNFVWAKLYKTETAKKYKFREDISMGEDVFWQHLVINDAKRIGVLSTPLYYYMQKTCGLSYSLAPRHIGLLEAHKERLQFIKCHYPDLVNAQLQTYWRTAYNFYRSTKRSDVELKMLFSQYFDDINAKYHCEFDDALKYMPEYMFHKSCPIVLDAYLQMYRVFSFVIRKLGYGEYERIPYMEQ